MRQLLFDIAATLYVLGVVLFVILSIVWAENLNNNYSEFSGGRGTVGLILVTVIILIIGSYVGDS